MASNPPTQLQSLQMLACMCTKRVRTGYTPAPVAIGYHAVTHTVDVIEFVVDRSFVSTLLYMCSYHTCMQACALQPMAWARDVTGFVASVRVARKPHVGTAHYGSTDRARSLRQDLPYRRIADDCRHAIHRYHGSMADRSRDVRSEAEGGRVDRCCTEHAAKRQRSRTTNGPVVRWGQSSSC